MTISSTLTPVLGYLVAIGGGMFIGYSDKHASEPQGTVLALLVLTLILGLAQPARPWRWPILVGLWVPLLDSLLPTRTPESNAGGLHGVWSFLALLLFVEAIGFVGAYAGMGLRRAAFR
ncbi:MAG: hypothetical protein ACRD3T_21080 [Terriglobia bacterium]